MRHAPRTVFALPLHAVMYLHLLQVAVRHIAMANFWVVCLTVLLVARRFINSGSLEHMKPTWYGAPRVMDRYS